MKLRLLFSFLLLTPTLFAQTFTEIPQIPPFDGVELSSIAFADVDGDNDQDLLITGLNSALDQISKLYTNDGEGTFSEVVGSPFEGVQGGSVAFADVDGDDDMDVLIAGKVLLDGISKLYINDGEGTFSESPDTPFEGVQNGAIAFADVDGDGDEDVLITGLNNSFNLFSKLYTNDGEGAFTEVIGTPFEAVRSSAIAFADVDGDNDQDVLITGRDNSLTSISKLYANDGMGTFSEVIDTPFEGVESGSVAFADIDGDNDQDVLITGQNNTGSPISRLYTNDGGGTFSEAPDTPFEGVQWSSVAFADVDGDNAPDVLITGRPGPGIRISRLYTNDGTGSYSEAMDLPFDDVQSGSIAFADVDGDNDQDVLITGLNSSSDRIAKLYVNGLVSSTEQLNIELKLDLIPYPNPAISDEINVIYHATKNGVARVKVLGLNGLLISQQEASVFIGQQYITIDISSLPPGSYFIQLEEGKRKGLAQFFVR